MAQQLRKLCALQRVLIGSAAPNGSPQLSNSSSDDLIPSPGFHRHQAHVGLSRVSIAVMKLHDQKQAEGERSYLASVPHCSPSLRELGAGTEEELPPGDELV